MAMAMDAPAGDAAERCGVPDDWARLDELAATATGPMPRVPDAGRALVSKQRSPEATRSRDDEGRRRADDKPGPAADEPKQQPAPAPLATRLYTLSYLVFFSLLGTLARIGLVALAKYPGAPVGFGTVWANFGGSLAMGFLAEERMLFRRPSRADDDAAAEPGTEPEVDADADTAAKMKKTMPLYIGLATGFCGSFTSFSSFVRDMFLALSNNDLAAPAARRNGGHSLMAMLAVLIATVSLSLSGLFLGAHLAMAMAASALRMPSVSPAVARRVLDPLGAVAGWGCWLAAVALCVWPPRDAWRGQATFALALAPPGCLLRFLLATRLNGRAATYNFPVGTFAANVLGTAVLGAAWDAAHARAGVVGVVGCQVLQGVEDGFCGCLTTVSTWVLELAALGRRHAYVYGAASVAAAFALLVAIMGGLRWSEGFGGARACG